MSQEKAPSVKRKEIRQKEDCIKENKTFFELWERAGWHQQPNVHNNVFEERLMTPTCTRSTRETKLYRQPDMIYYN